MEGRIEVIVGDISDALPGSRVFSVVMANLIARILADKAEAISRQLAPGGILICSGVIEERETLVIDAFAAQGLAATFRVQAGDWVALRFERG
ncbi:MAG TPA: 50S ribosomal protein L11 methyltransferase, partial [Thermomicrobiales bacterium]|nr:50S ribosomal protein L11 methyltransferase [Thermomicrobiales bacterium]